MGRRTVTVDITAPGRDTGKRFIITEMPALRAERWAVRLFTAMGRSGVDIPQNVLSAGLAGVAVFSAQALGSVNYADIDPLLREMMDCVRIVPDPSRPEVTRALVDSDTAGDDIEEIATRMHIRKEWLKLHLDPFLSARGLTFPSFTETGANGSNT